MSNLVPTDPNGNLPATAVADDDDVVGLEDLDPTDLTIPRLKIVHRDAEFEDNLTNERHKELRVIILGLIKQRILWHPEVEDDAKPLCKSFDHEVGFPDMDNFPWKASAFDKGSVQMVTVGDDERPTLPCSACPLKDWGTHPTRAKVPWCNEQYTLSLLVDSGNDTWLPALVTFKGAGIKPTKTYLGSFQRTRQAPFTCVTRLTLEANRRGSVDYATPKFEKQEATDPAMKAEYAAMSRSIREFVKTPRAARDDDEDTTNSSSSKATAQAAPAKAAPPPPADDSDLPW